MALAPSSDRVEQVKAREVIEETTRNDLSRFSSNEFTALLRLALS